MFPRASLFLRSILVCSLAAAALSATAAPSYRFSRLFDAGTSLTAVGEDGGGNIYVTGYGSSGPITSTFIAKLDPTGTNVLYRTTIATSPSIVLSTTNVFVTNGGDAYVVGYGNQLVTFNVAQQPAAALGAADVFIAKISDTGTILFVRRFGGSGDDFGNRIAVDSQSNIVVGGQTTSANFPVANALQPAKSGSGADAFVTKLTPDGQTVLFSTYFGGSNSLVPGRSEETINGLTVDQTDSIFIVGASAAVDLPLRNALRTVPAGGDAFVAGLSPSGSLTFSTYVGGSGADEADDITAASIGIFVGGTTASSDFPSGNDHPSPTNGNSDAFILRIAKDGSSINVPFLFGGSGSESVSGIAINGLLQVVVTGGTTSADFPTVFGLQPSAPPNPQSSTAFLTVLSTRTIKYSSYLGGSQPDVGTGISSRLIDQVVVVGNTFSPDFPLTPPNTPAGGPGFITAVDPAPPKADKVLTQTVSRGPYFVGLDVVYTATLSNRGPDRIGSASVVYELPPQLTFVNATASQGTCSGTTRVSCNVGTLATGAAATITLRVQPNQAGTFSNPAFAVGIVEVDPVSNDSPLPAAIVVQPASAIPTLGETALVIFGLLLAVAGARRIAG